MAAEEAVSPVAKPNMLLMRWLWLLVVLVGIPSVVVNWLLPTPTSMETEEGQIVVIVSCFTVLAWLSLSIYFLRLYRESWRSEPRFAIVLAALTMDAFRNAAENIYFGVAYSGWIQIIPHRIMRLLWEPQVMIVSRLLGLATAIVIVWLVTERGFENLKLREQRSLLLEQRNRELTALQELSSLVSGTLDLQTVLERVCTEIVEALRFRSALLCLVNEESGTILGAAGCGVPQSLVSEAVRDLDGGDILADIVRTGQTEVISGWDDRFDRTTFVTYGHAQSVRVFAPIADAQGPVGVVEATVSPDAPPPDEHRLQLLHSFLRQACNAIRNARLHETVVADRERLNLLTGSLEDKNQQLESFVYIVSHDLKAPLVSIQGFLTLLDEECASQLSEDGRFYLSRLRSNTEHLQELIFQLLELSRAGRVTGHREWINMDELAGELNAMVSPILAENRVEMRIDRPLPQVFGDRTQMRQLFLNLLDNGIKYMGDSIVRQVEMSGKETRHGVVFAVADTGIGIPEEMRERVFQVFQRLSGAGSDGSGVGLAIVRKIAEANGGRAWVEARTDGRGSVFYVSLPYPDLSKEYAEDRGEEGTDASGHKPRASGAAGSVSADYPDRGRQP